MNWYRRGPSKGATDGVISRATPSARIKTRLQVMGPSHGVLMSPMMRCIRIVHTCQPTPFRHISIYSLLPIGVDVFRLAKSELFDPLLGARVLEVVLNFHEISGISRGYMIQSLYKLTIKFNITGDKSLI